jgi:hypothetical protein
MCIHAVKLLLVVWDYAVANCEIKWLRFGFHRYSGPSFDRFSIELQEGEWQISI